MNTNTKTFCKLLLITKIIQKTDDVSSTPLIGLACFFL